MVEDKQYVTVCNLIARELEDIVVEFNRNANGLQDKEALIALRLKQLDALQGSIDKNRRILDFHSGKKVEPQQHYGEAVLIGVGSQQ